jgi:large subunit ribosomal protein L2
VKNLTTSLKKSGGRNNSGNITSFHIGGGHKQRYRLVDFSRQHSKNKFCIVRTIEQDPNRSAFISLFLSETGDLTYILSTEGVKIGDVLIGGNKYAVMQGSSMNISNIPLGYNVHSFSRNGLSSNLVRAAGCYGQILKKAGNKALVKLPSGKKIVVGLNASATIGKLSNSKHRYKVYHKAGRIRWYGKTSVVRGVAMNPVDHPMGGKTHGKLHRTPWGKLAKGIKTARK